MHCRTLMMCMIFCSLKKDHIVGDSGGWFTIYHEIILGIPDSYYLSWLKHLICQFDETWIFRHFTWASLNIGGTLLRNIYRRPLLWVKQLRINSMIFPLLIFKCLLIWMFFGACIYIYIIHCIKIHLMFWFMRPTSQDFFCRDSPCRKASKFPGREERTSILGRWIISVFVTRDGNGTKGLQEWYTLED